jgi:PAS domain S-box-containing protein
MPELNPYDSFPAAVTVCDPEGKITYMNPAAGRLFAKYGGTALVGSNLLDCHPEPARSKLSGMLRDRRSNTYIVEKNGAQRMIYQTPWFADDGSYAGFLEMSFEIPATIPKIVRS